MNSLLNRAVFGTVLCLGVAAATAAPAVTFGPTGVRGGTSAIALETGIVRIASSYSPTVYQIQRGLNERGFDAGPADGLMGSRTSSAIKAYERENGLLVTGYPSSSLLDHINSTRVRSSTTTTQTVVVPAVVPAPSQPSTTLVVGVQDELRRRGYDIPVINGILDEPTREAVRRYQYETKLPLTGVVSEALLTHLRGTATTTQGMSQKDLTQKIQQALIARGYDPGPADGASGPKTRFAIQTYQSDAGLPITGLATQSLLGALKATTGTQTGSGSTTGEQTVTAVDRPEKFVPLLRDRFKDGNYTDDPRWVVVAGSFHIDGNQNLRSKVEPVVTQNTTDPNDLGKAILRNVLEGAFGVQTVTQQNVAQIVTLPGIDNAFRVTISMRSHGTQGRLLFGVFNEGSNDGYRLGYASGGTPTLELMSAQSKRIRVLSSNEQAIDLDDGKAHIIELTRHLDGLMTVVVDSRQLMTIRDDSHSGNFDGFLIVNAGGDYGIDKVTIDAIRPDDV